MGSQTLYLCFQSMLRGEVLLTQHAALWNAEYMKTNALNILANGRPASSLIPAASSERAVLHFNVDAVTLLHEAVGSLAFLEQHCKDSLQCIHSLDLQDNTLEEHSQNTMSHVC